MLPRILAVEVSVSPTAEGMPGGALLQTLVDWTGQLGLVGAVISILLGGGLYGVAHFSGHHNGSYRGRQLAYAGAIGAVLVGLAPILVNTLFKAASSGS